MKKILCLLLALAVCCMLITVAAAADTATVPTTCAAGCEDPVWEPLPSGNTWRTLEAGHYHYYLTQNDTSYRYTPNPGGTVSSTNSGNAVTICLDLNGYNITTNGRALGVYKNCVLNIMDSSAAQTGYIQGSTGDNNSVGGTMFNYGTVNLYSGTMRYVYDGVGTNPAYAGGVMVVYASGTLNMYGGKMEGGELVTKSGATTCGGTIRTSGTVNLQGGEIISGSVPEGSNGPCIYAQESAQVTLSNDAKVDNIYIGSSSAKINVSGTYSGKARITCGSSIAPSDGKVIGTATNSPSITGDLFCTNGDGWLVNVSGSNLQLATFTPSGELHYCEHCKEVVKWTAMTKSNWTTFKTTPGSYHYYLAESQAGTGSSYPQLVSGAQVCLDIYGNTLTCSGRALLANGGSILNLMDTKGGGFVAGGPGTNNPRGGTVTVSGNATMNMYSGVLKYVAGSGDAKNGMVAIGGTLNLYGGKIEGADFTNQSSSVGGAVYLYNATSAFNAYGGEVTSGKVGSIGPCVYVSVTGPTVKLAGDAYVENIYFPSNNKTLTVSGDYTGTASVTYGTAPALGAEVGISDNARILGTLTCTNGDRSIKTDGEKLIVTIDAPVVIVEGATETSYETLVAAIEGFESGYIKLMKPLTESVTVAKDLRIDLNGNSITGTVTVAEGATLYGMDSQTDDYTVADGFYGTLTVSGSVAAQEGYLLVTEGDQLSFHRVTFQITDMVLRPSAAGIYYSSAFLGDEKVAGAVTQFGVALSVYAVPNEDNLGTLCRYSAYTEFEAGAAGNASTSTLLKGILKTGNSDSINTRNLNMDIYGRPYIKTSDGYLFGQTQCRDLAEQLTGADDSFDTLTGSQRYALMELYETYHAVLKEEELPQMAQNKVSNEETLSILMVGNSFCYYYVEELYGLLMANPDPNRGYNKVEIYNLYYSGCKLNQHYDWWISGAANYELYKTDENGRKKQTPDAGTAWSLEDTLMQGKWDYISLQGASTEVDYVTQNTESICAAIIPYTEPLLERFHELFPDAQLLWHRTWAFEDGRVTSARIYNEESLAAYDAGMQAACDYMCNEFDQDKPYDLIMVNSGAAWSVARAENAKLETSLIPEGGLCARLNVRNENTYPYFSGNANAGDGYHDGDIGGGQFLNACVWYETITGQSVLENSYQPSLDNGKYELSDALAALLRNAAHAALNK